MPGVPLIRVRDLRKQIGVVFGQGSQLWWDLPHLVRPVDPLLQLMTRRFNLTVLGDLLGGIALIVAGASQVDVAWTAPSVGFLMLAPLVGVLLFLVAYVFWRRQTRRYSSRGL